MVCSFVFGPGKSRKRVFSVSSFYFLAVPPRTMLAPGSTVPILTGSTAYFTRVTAGQYQDAPSVSPLLVVALGR